MLNVRKVTHRPTYFVDTDAGEVEVQFEPIDTYTGIHVERVGDKLVVAYRVQDSDPSNPMTDYDCQGTLYTKPTRGYGGGVITDNMGELLNALRLDGENEVDEQVNFTINGLTQSLADHALDTFTFVNYGNDLVREWIEEGHCRRSYETDELDDEDIAVGWRDDVKQSILLGNFKLDEFQALMLDLYKKHWREIVGPYVVPVHYCSSNHGPGTTSCGVANWDGDPDDLPDGVWVADSGAIENINHAPLPRNVHVKYDYNEQRWRVLHEVPGGVNQEFTEADYAFTFAHTPGPGDVAWAAERYAEGILSEYAEWCNGNVYGCCVETFVNAEEDPGEPAKWEQESEDSCWGFIGSEYAERTLKEDFFDPAVRAASKEIA